MGEESHSPSPLWGGTARSETEPGWGAKGPERGRAYPTRSSLRADHPPHEGEGEIDCAAVPHPSAASRHPPSPEGEGEAIDLLSADSLGRQMWARHAHEGQRPESDDWRTWVFLGGRGAGKTRAGAEWVWETAQALGAGGRIALVGATLHDARTVMVEGPSGLLRLPYRTGARYVPSLRRVTFPGGAVGLLFSAGEPERLRGPQFHAAWGDEFCAWDYPDEALAMLRLGVRLGDWPVRASASLLGRGQKAPPSRPDAAWASPKLVLTSTPKPRASLRKVLAEEGCTRTDAPMAVNADNLAPGFVAAMQDLYGGTRRAAQELEGRVLEAEGALFTLAEIERARRLGEEWARCSPSPEVGRDVGVKRRQGGEFQTRPTRSLRDHPPHEGEGERGRAAAPHPSSPSAQPPSPGGEGEHPSRPDAPALDRVVVAVDPPAGTLSGRARDACGIVVAGRRRDRVLVLADRTARGLSPEGWAERVRGAVEAFGATRVVVESNNGGAMAEAVLKASGMSVAIKRVHASTGKAARAEPVAALYEQGRVAHAPGLGALEEELLGLGDGDAGGSSPDRADALVWAVTELMPAPGVNRGPRVSVV